MENQLKRYEVKHEGKQIRVFDTIDKKYITKDCPSMKVAQEICDDFNAMENKDFRPLGLPDFRPN